MTKARTPRRRTRTLTLAEVRDAHARLRELNDGQDDDLTKILRPAMQVLRKVESALSRARR